MEVIITADPVFTKVVAKNSITSLSVKSEGVNYRGKVEMPVALMDLRLYCNFADKRNRGFERKTS